MKQKIAYMSIGMIFTIILSFTFMSFASSTTEVVGKLTVIDEDNHKVSLFDGQKKWDFNVNSNTIIYKNDQKVDLSALTFDDEVKILLNSNEEVRYVVATHKEESTNPTVVKPVDAVPVNSNKGESLASQEQTVRTDRSVQPNLVRELELKLGNGPQNEYKLKYKNKSGKVETEIEKKTGRRKIKAKGDQAKATVEVLIKKMALTSDMSKQEITEKVMTVLGINQEFREFELKVQFADGEKVETKMKKEEKHDNEHGKHGEKDEEDD